MKNRVNVKHDVLIRVVRRDGTVEQEIRPKEKEDKKHDR